MLLKSVSACRRTKCAAELLESHLQFPHEVPEPCPVLTSGGAVTFAALADKYGLQEADVYRLVRHAMTGVFEEPRDIKVVHRRANMLQVEVGERQI